MSLKRVAEQRRVPRFERRVAAGVVDAFDAALVQLDGVAGAARKCISAAEVGVDLVPVDRGEALVLERGLEQGRGFRPFAAAACEGCERHPGAQRRLAVGECEGLVEQCSELRLDVGRVAETHRELEIGEAQLALLLRRRAGSRSPDSRQ